MMKKGMHTHFLKHYPLKSRFFRFMFHKCFTITKRKRAN